MSIMLAEPEMLAATAGELQSINVALRAGNAAAAIPTTGVVPAAADLVSLLTATQFVTHAQLYQQISAQAAAVQEQLATTLGISAGSYAATEAANATTIS
ncbi:PE family protein [Mycobacterium shinjukuense]|uniref:PE family protein PE32 n=1 Tax=Mycobacterium shinjukuense TaxID=398694 RepID=A0A7I7MUU6_9MYCO|nr:PE family protein [Mycobacterium shinjukuense]MCV6986746.1 PE family protein [Mycobacterium shinjukuense]ORB63822.1 PE family protein [Mycobacterium shinjukuense]BBX75895.1 PE family protein PE32 [Mycobacterium shinjukuense]